MKSATFRPAKIDHRTSAFRSRTPQIAESRTAKESVDAGAYRPFECSIGGATSIRQAVELSPRKFYHQNRPRTPENLMVHNPTRRPVIGQMANQTEKTIMESVQKSAQRYSATFRSKTPQMGGPQKHGPWQRAPGDWTEDKSPPLHQKYRRMYERIQEETKAAQGPSNSRGAKFQTPDALKRLLVRNSPGKEDVYEIYYEPEEPKPSLAKMVENSPRRYSHVRSTTPRFQPPKAPNTSEFTPHADGILAEMESLAVKNKKGGRSYFQMTHKASPRFRPVKSMYTAEGNIIPGDNDVKKSLYAKIKESPIRYAIVHSENARFEDWKAILKQKEREIRVMQAKEDNLMFSKEMIAQYVRRHKGAAEELALKDTSFKERSMQKFNVADPEVFDLDDLENMKLEDNGATDDLVVGGDMPF